MAWGQQRENARVYDTQALSADDIAFGVNDGIGI